MNSQPIPEETEQDLPESNTLGGTTSTQAGPDGEQGNTPQPETVGLTGANLEKADEVAQRIDERNQKK